MDYFTKTRFSLTVLLVVFLGIAGLTSHAWWQDKLKVDINPSPGAQVAVDELTIIANGVDVYKLIIPYKGIILYADDTLDVYHVRFPVKSLSELQVIEEVIDRSGADAIKSYPIDPRLAPEQGFIIVKEDHSELSTAQVGNLQGGVRHKSVSININTQVPPHNAGYMFAGTMTRIGIPNLAAIGSVSHIDRRSRPTYPTEIIDESVPSASGSGNEGYVIFIPHNLLNA